MENTSTLPTFLPDLRWIRGRLREAGLRRYTVLGAAIVGSYARGQARPDSDLDIAVILPYSSRITSLKRSERYHARFRTNDQLPRWQGIQVDIQFFYPTDEALAGYARIDLVADHRV